MEITLGEITDFLGGTIIGDRNSKIKGASTIEGGKTGTISFLSNLKYEEYVYSSDASAILVDKSFEPSYPVKAALIRVDNVYESLAKLLDKFNVNDEVVRNISPNSSIHPKAILGNNVGVGTYSIIDEDTHIGNNVEIDNQVYIGKRCVIGDNTILKPGVKIMDDSVIGANVIIHSNTVIGSDGFGFAPTGEGNYVKIRQLGNVIIEDDVEIGSNCSIDRATFGSTLIHSGAKLDNLIQIAHNVEIGSHTVIAAQTGIAGSAKIGEGCKIGGQVGIVGHIQIADGTQIQAQSGIQSSVKIKNSRLFGSPALDYSNYLRSYAIFKNLPSLAEKMDKLGKATLGLSNEHDS
ncbi:MAG: UDP-3-O-(3-hydroxymyristoyl)glucosamine N-acyltransferase [Saprospiraceae bacterium]|jgi:UDP-3-O-[3-hydroxymyristoyl] glucosamine N-acyltransferase|uniref:UDP-3-O-(3-hydroxymyristoyl)glucosamine N-acyltransferase n=1 Tax=Candidatus Brachybacter algidus TaxID=2982024 RepID=UPI001B516B83|nr:UDP-3-O-(3-hydroxymyristoyl)glucosamine N-acyltransferase [Candidatus Brachybacter algidus]MBP7540843.1 UDP-3-O-(3-hydroxymyristoyl)glucosamine N-acyltransferase [Saprospiraceae bacterium]MBK7602174.1 UDP-3-O-(3-hydroxymyristoyl)glucosamine N-acyltransferase [Candidatus Brachybacter algidus]MBK9025287.1 UDP-3-O-(3-hydroxymyristoyl)glucosamine N-acyltransferase [Candidatus Brachybacter algidus]MBL0120331.1 UDP-3-O-(3-hydroxymyristoyl)glucosamine N-acyltransferase [Candidatus Brachybacter algi